MIKKIFIVYILLCNILSFVSQTLNITDAKGLKQGKWVEKDKDGNIKYDGQFKDNLPIGKFLFYYPDKKIKSEIVYADNGKDAKAIFYYENGKKKALGNYINQKKDKKWTYYNAEEILVSEEEYLNGLKEGVSVVYFLSGKKAEVDSFIHDKRNGICIKYFENGNKKVEINYIDDIPEGRYIEYFQEGTFKTIGKYLDGVKSGKWDYYDADGLIHFKESYNKGERIELFKINGEFEEYFDNPEEILKEKTTYKDGKKHGRFIEYYEAGEWKFKTVSYDQDLYPGAQDEMVKYFDGQKIKTQGEYYNDQLHGKITHYDELGNVVKVETYDKGQKISEE